MRYPQKKPPQREAIRRVPTERPTARGQARFWIALRIAATAARIFSARPVGIPATVSASAPTPFSYGFGNHFSVRYFSCSAPLSFDEDSITQRREFVKGGEEIFCGCKRFLRVAPRPCGRQGRMNSCPDEVSACAILRAFSSMLSVSSETSFQRKRTSAVSGMRT